MKRRRRPIKETEKKGEHKKKKHPKENHNKEKRKRREKRHRNPKRPSSFEDKSVTTPVARISHYNT
jgi:hypothetical protein